MNQSTITSGNFVLLSADDLTLVVPREGIVEVEHLRDRQMVEQQLLTDTITLNSYLANQAAKDAYICCNRHLKIMTVLPTNRYACLSWFNHPQLKWCWSEIKILDHTTLTQSILPPCLTTPQTPISAIATLPDNSTAFMTTSQKLFDYILGPR